jgi:hypothetical protein
LKAKRRNLEKDSSGDFIMLSKTSKKKRGGHDYIEGNHKSTSR